MDVWITSDGTDNLFSAGYEFRITGSTLSGALQFRATGDQSNSEQSEPGPPEYVFLGDTDPGNFFANRQPVETQLIGGDFTASGANMPLINGSVRLLARLEIEHITATPLAAVGNVFQLGLWNEDQGTADQLDDSTLFMDELGNPLTFAAGSAPSTTSAPGAFLNLGTITVTAAVPEPGTFVALAVAAAGLSARRWRRQCSG